MTKKHTFLSLKVKYIIGLLLVKISMAFSQLNQTIEAEEEEEGNNTSSTMDQVKFCPASVDNKYNSNSNIIRNNITDPQHPQLHYTTSTSFDVDLRIPRVSLAFWTSRRLIWVIFFHRRQCFPA